MAFLGWVMIFSGFWATWPLDLPFGTVKPALLKAARYVVTQVQRTGQRLF